MDLAIGDDTLRISMGLYPILALGILCRERQAVACACRSCDHERHRCL